MLKFTYNAAEKLAFSLSVDESMHPRNAESSTTYIVQQAPIFNEDGLITGYHDDLYVVAATGEFSTESYIL